MPSADQLTHHVELLRDLARRTRKLAQEKVDQGEQQRLERHAAELEQQAARIEHND